MICKFNNFPNLDMYDVVALQSLRPIKDELSRGEESFSGGAFGVNKARGTGQRLMNFRRL